MSKFGTKNKVAIYTEMEGVREINVPVQLERITH